MISIQASLLSIWNIHLQSWPVPARLQLPHIWFQLEFSFIAALKLFFTAHSRVCLLAPITMPCWKNHECPVMPVTRTEAGRLCICFKMSCGMAQAYKTTNCWLAQCVITLNGDLTYVAAAVRWVVNRNLQTNPPLWAQTQSRSLPWGCWSNRIYVLWLTHILKQTGWYHCRNKTELMCFS